MSQRPYRSRSVTARRRPPRRRSCLGQIAGIGVALLVIVALYGVLARPALSGLIGAQISDRLGPTSPAGAAVDQAAAALPGVVAALPPGQIVVGQGQANAFLDDHREDYAPIDQIRVRFTPGQAVADLSALGVPGVARSGLAAVDGRVALRDPQIDGALGLAISSADLLAPLAERLNAELDRQGKYVEDIQIQEGQIVIVTR
ncbi:hypothetical protein K2Z83_22315 [Oscillochloris sp. ZM17-4]|uniref:hypothetical protein n=1 Tax=Oscillochloris sp. ZM17-4 TaxID=2866714 RepID=UPI001C73635E|nr:hypothetical protein [Oscillochloris sp. ZM17-4]MBX0330399.1 hypothetical protein [Oscillochloris sp. ZM17-4]